MIYKSTIYDNNRIYIQVNQRNPFKSRTSYKRENYSRNNEGYMPIKDVYKQNRRWLKKLIALGIDSSKCRFITLTLSQNMNWNELLSKFQTFINALRRKYDKNLYYIRSIEVSKESLHFHVHLVLVFDNPPQIKRQDIRSLWQYGNVDMVYKVENVYDIADYLTLNSKPVAQSEDISLSYYPKGAKIFSTTIKTPAEKRETGLGVEEIKRLIAYCIQHHIRFRLDKHYYFENGIKKEVLDGLFLMPGEEYIINNFGTKEDDELLAQLCTLKKNKMINDKGGDV